MGSSRLSLILVACQGRSSRLYTTEKFGKFTRSVTSFPEEEQQLMEFYSNSRKRKYPFEVEKENIPMKQTQPDYSFLSCTEIFCEPIIETKQQQIPKQNLYQHQQMYPKLLQNVKSHIDTTLIEDNRVLWNLIKNEQRYLPKYPNYFKTVQVEVKPHMRKIVSDWMLEVCQELCCPPEVFCLAMNLMDRFLAKCRIEKSQLQLLGAVCLFLSSKFKETAPIPSEKLVMYTDFSVTLESIREWELFVLYKLKWDLGASTGLDYLDYILPKLQTDTIDAKKVRSHTETVIALSATHYLFSYVRPSVIAASAIAVTYRSLLHKFTEDGARMFLGNLQQVTHTDLAEIEACSAAMFQTLDFLTSTKPSDDPQDTLVNSFENSSLLVKSC